MVRPQASLADGVSVLNSRPACHSSIRPGETGPGNKKRTTQSDRGVPGADVLVLDETVLAAAGIARPEEPPLAHYGREVRVEIFSAERVGPGGRPEA